MRVWVVPALHARVTEGHLGEASRAGSLGQLALAEIQPELCHGWKVCAALMIHADCWFGPLVTLFGVGLMVGGGGGLIDQSYTIYDSQSLHL